jgi:hypothetical protein
MGDVNSILSDFEEYCALMMSNHQPNAPADHPNIYNYFIYFNSFNDSLKIYGNLVKHKATWILSEADDDDVRYLMDELLVRTKKWMLKYIQEFKPE